MGKYAGYFISLQRKWDGVDADTDFWNKCFGLTSFLHISKSTTSTQNASKIVQFKYKWENKQAWNWLRLALNSFENYTHTDECFFFFFKTVALVDIITTMHRWTKQLGKLVKHKLAQTSFFRNACQI